MNNYFKALILTYVFFIIAGCSSKQGYFKFKYSGVGMDNTLKTNVFYSFIKKDEYVKGDVIAFENKDIVSGHTGVSIFRILGIPGDTVLFSKGLSYVNNKLFNLPTTSKRTYIHLGKDADNLLENYKILYKSDDSTILNLSREEYERLSNNKPNFIMPYYSYDKYEYTILKFNKEWNRDFFGPLVIPVKITLVDTPNILRLDNSKSEDISDSYYFVIGDNLQSSIDSRYIGLIPKRLIYGKLIR